MPSTSIMRWIAETLVGVRARPASQPEPKFTLVAQFGAGGEWATAITRVWADQRATRDCRLCPRCLARDGVCQVVITDFIADHQAPSYDSNGLKRVGIYREVQAKPPALIEV